MPLTRNIALTIAYDGTGYAGWQRQRDDLTIQGVIEDKLATMTAAATVLHGAGRTDAGVHALGMVANFHTAAPIPVDAFARGLNSLLPDDIRILAAKEAPLHFHARRSALGKAYEYHLNVGPVQLPTERLYAAQVKTALDLDAMRAGLKLLVGEHDFSSFEAAGSRDPYHAGGRGAVRRIFGAALQADPQNPGRLRFVVAGDGFLRHMVRNIVGTMIEVGRGKIAASDLAEILLAKDRQVAGPTAPARGLFLVQVFYGQEPTKI